MTDLRCACLRSGLGAGSVVMVAMVVAAMEEAMAAVDMAAVRWAILIVVRIDDRTVLPTAKPRASLFPCDAAASTSAAAASQITIAVGWARATFTPGKGRGMTAMRSWLAVAAMVGLIAAPAQAQIGGGGRTRGGEKAAEPK